MRFIELFQKYSIRNFDFSIAGYFKLLHFSLILPKNISEITVEMSLATFLDTDIKN